MTALVAALIAATAALLIAVVERYRWHAMSAGAGSAPTSGRSTRRPPGASRPAQDRPLLRRRGRAPAGQPPSAGS